MRQSVLIVLLALFVSSACRSPGADVVARVEDHELTVDGLSGMLADWDSRPLELDFVDQFVRNWVHLGLLAERFAAGDSLLDSALVLESMWPDVSEFLTADLLDRLFSEHLQFDSANVDSIYRAGELRVVWYMLYRVDAQMSPQEREAQRALATDLRAQLIKRGPWNELTTRNENGELRLVRGGNLELFRAGRTVPEFDRASRALRPGEVSTVIETPFGYHVIYRPLLGEIAPEFAQWAKRDLIAEFDTLYGQRLVEDGEFRMQPTAVQTIRDVAKSPGLHIDEDEVIAIYRGGALTTGRVVRWLQYLPSEMNVELLEETDEGVARIVRDIVRREMLWNQVDSAGLQLADSVFVWLRGRHQSELSRVSRALLISPSLLLEAADTPSRRRQVAHERITQYIDAVVSGRRGMVTLQPFVAEALRRTGDWMINRPAMERAIQYARARQRNRS